MIEEVRGRNRGENDQPSETKFFAFPLFPRFSQRSHLKLFCRSPLYFPPPPFRFVFYLPNFGQAKGRKFSRKDIVTVTNRSLDNLSFAKLKAAILNLNRIFHLKLKIIEYLKKKNFFTVICNAILNFSLCRHFVFIHCFALSFLRMNSFSFFNLSLAVFFFSPYLSPFSPKTKFIFLILLVFIFNSCLVLTFLPACCLPRYSLSRIRLFDDRLLDFYFSSFPFKQLSLFSFFFFFYNSLSNV